MAKYFGRHRDSCISILFAIVYRKKEDSLVCMLADHLPLLVSRTHFCSSSFCVEEIISLFHSESHFRFVCRKAEKLLVFAHAYHFSCLFHVHSRFLFLRWENPITVPQCKSLSSVCHKEEKLLVYTYADYLSLLSLLVSSILRWGNPVIVLWC